MSSLCQLLTYSNNGKTLVSLTVAKDPISGWVVKGGDFLTGEEVESWLPVDTLKEEVLQKIHALNLPSYFPPEFKKAVAEHIEMRRKPGDNVSSSNQKHANKEKAFYGALKENLIKH